MNYESFSSSCDILRQVQHKKVDTFISFWECNVVSIFWSVEWLFVGRTNCGKLLLWKIERNMFGYKVEWPIWRTISISVFGVKSVYWFVAI